MSVEGVTMKMTVSQSPDEMIKNIIKSLLRKNKQVIMDVSPVLVTNQAYLQPFNSGYRIYSGLHFLFAH